MSSTIVQPFYRFEVKRKQQEVRLQQAKRPKFETGMSDLNYDCLEMIFQRMDMESLLSIAQVNKQFMELAAPLVKANQEPIAVKNITCFEEDRTLPGEWHFLLKYSLIKDLGIGSSITKLFFDMQMMTWRDAEDIINACSELKELHIRNCSYLLYNGIDKPFDKLEVFTVYNGILGTKLSQLHKWFPKLRSLSLNCIVEDESAIVTSLERDFPTLKSIGLSVRNQSKSTASIRNVDKVIKHNPQLSKISLNEWGFGCKPRDLRNLNKCVPGLVELKMCTRLNSFKRCSVRTIDFEWVTKFVLSTDPERKSSGPIPCPLKFSQLRDLEIRINDRNDNWIFFANNLSKLNLRIRFDPDIEFLMKISKTWPNLTEVTIFTEYSHNFWVDELLQFIESLTSLQRLNVLRRFYVPSFIETLEKAVPNKYKVMEGTEGRVSIVRL